MQKTSAQANDCPQRDRTESDVYMEGLETPQDPNKEPHQMRGQRIQRTTMGIL